MEDVKKLRKKIDEVDEQILLSLGDRTKICRLIGLLKKKQGLPVRDYQRENDLYVNVTKKAVKLGLDPTRVEAIYRQIIEMCAAVQ